MMIFIRGMVLLFVCCLSAANAADTGWLLSPDNPHAEIRLRAEHAVGNPVRLLLDIRLAEDWKTYWRSPGEGGIAPRITWRDSSTSQWYWPVPQRFDVSGLTVQGYKHTVTFPLELHRGSSLILQGVLTLSTCNRICLLTDYSLQVDLREATPAGFEQDYVRAMGHIPTQNGPVQVNEVVFDQGTLRLTAENPAGWENPALFLDTLSGFNLAEPILTTDNQRLTATVSVTDEFGEAVTHLDAQNLSLVITSGENAQHVTVPITPPHAPSLVFWSMLLSAVLGGLILNLMPCVLPVLGMKLSSVLRVGLQEQRLIRWRFLATTGGIFTSFMLLALLMTGLRLTGAATGWGIQFQSPWFIGAMVLVTLLFSLNLAGFFAFRLPT